MKKLKQALRTLEALGEQTAVHRKKFEFTIAQCRNILTELEKKTITYNVEFELFHKMLDIQELMSHYTLQSWAVPTISNPPNHVFDQLRVYFNDIAYICHDYHSFRIDLEEYQNYNFLDLRAILASFTQYLTNENLDADVREAIEDSVSSIKEILPDVPDFHSFSPIPVDYLQWRVNLNEFVCENEIGYGVSAHVFSGFKIDTQEKVAIKQFTTSKLNGNNLQAFQREVSALANAQHPAVIKLIGATDTPPFCIITSWMPNGSLYHDLHHGHQMNETMRTIAAYDIARGMEFLHSRNIIHRDMKSLNILLDDNLHAKICDFGFSRMSGDSCNSLVGTPHWMAPELFTRASPITNKIDVYAYAIVLWEIVTCQTPYDGIDRSEVSARVAKDDMRPALPVGLSPGLVELMTLAWDRDPENRPSFAEIVKRFRKGDVFLPGADLEAVMDYIETSATDSECKNRKVEKILSEIESNEQVVDDHVCKTLHEIGIPTPLLDRAWDTLKDDERMLDMFIGTSKQMMAAKMLKNVTKTEIIEKFVLELPTGSSEVDKDIVLAANLHGVHALAALFVSGPEEIALSLEVTAVKGVDQGLRQAVIDRCVLALAHKTQYVRIAALRCLLSLREFKRLKLFVLHFLEGEEEPMFSLTCLGIAGGSPVNEANMTKVIDHLLKKTDVSWMALCTLAKRSQSAALYILENIKPFDKVDRVLRAIRTHQELSDRAELANF